MATVFGKKKKKKVCLNSIKMEKGLLVSEVVEKHFTWSTCIMSHEKRFCLNKDRVEGAIAFLFFFTLSRY